MFLWSSGLALLLLSQLVKGDVKYSEGEVPTTPIALDQDTFPKAIHDPVNKFWFLKFYAPWCGHW
jgi:hypothetical protein